MNALPAYDISVYDNGQKLPQAVEAFFADELAYSRMPLPAGRRDRDLWRFACICAVADSGTVLGGVHLEIGPINFGPLREEKLAYIEQVLVRPEFRGQGLGIELLEKAVAVTAAAGCQYIRCCVNWDNPAEIALFKKCGFALVDLNEPGEGGEYLAIKPLQGSGCGR